MSRAVVSTHTHVNKPVACYRSSTTLLFPKTINITMPAGKTLDSLHSPQFQVKINRGRMAGWTPPEKHPLP